MRVISLNVNGIRAAQRKGMFAWLSKQDADIICLQETKAQRVQLSGDLFFPTGYQAYFHDAEKKGYSGTAIYSRYQPNRVVYGLGWKEADLEGRYLHLEFDDMTIASLYLPSGSSGDARQAVKFDFMDKYGDILAEIKRYDKNYIICGDWNIVHKEIDIKNFKANQRSSGCLPKERAWLDDLLSSEQFFDAFRLMDQRDGQYTWWSNRGKAWDNNVGWRIDYQIITQGLAKLVKGASIYKDERFSDHAPLTIDYDYKLSAKRVKAD